MDSKFEDELLADSGDDDSQSHVVVSSSEVQSPKEVEDLKTSSDDDDDDSDPSGDEVDARLMREAQVKTNDSSDLDSSEDEDEGMEVDEDALQAELAVVKDKLAEDPWGYHLHVEKIRLLRAMGDLEGSRRAREKMNEEYPLTPTMWLEWIRDEQKVMSDASEREYVIRLFERAVDEYMSVEVWLEYISFYLGNMDDVGGIEKCRDIFEMALANCGLHVSMGSLLWDAYRDFEGALIGSQATEELQTAQEQRYVSLCRRQLKVPLFDMEGTYATVEQKLGEIDESTRNAYKTAKQKLREVEDWEARLIKDSDYTEKRRVFAEYIEAEKKKSAKGNPVRVQCLYERALTEMPLDHYFWNDYVDFLSRHLKIPQVILKVAERATRNCGYSAVTVWLSLMKAIEVFYTQSLEAEDELKKSSLLLEKMLKVFEQACVRIGMTVEGAGTLWLKYLEFLRRQVNLGNLPQKDTKEPTNEEKSENKKENVVLTLRKTFILAENHLRTLVEEPNDFIGEIAMFKARFEAQIESSITDSVRELWKDLFRRGYSANFSFWNQYIGEEVRYKGLETKLIRKELSKAMKFVRDYPQLIANLWLNFERDHGDITSLGIAETQISEALEKHSATSVAAYQVASDTTDHKDEKGSYFKKNNNDDYGKGKKRKWEDKKEPSKFSPKKGKYGSHEDETDGQIVKDDGGFKKPAVPPPPGRRGKESQELPSSSTTKSGKVTDSVPPAPVKHDSTKDSRTVFLSNLDFSTDEVAINNFFATTGELEEIRIVKDFKGRSKGFAYVVFKNENCAKTALTLDRKPLGKRPAYVSKCDPDKSTRQPQFKYARSLERNKLFVKGLPFEMDEKELRCMFEAFGPVKDCRLVTYRNGHSKGIAYLEFEQEAHASAAILKTDGSTIKGKEISVAISNPPMKGQPQSLHFTPSKSEPNLRRERNVFVPRIVQSSATSSKNPAKPQPPLTNSETAPTTKTTGPKTNDDFRKMFMKS